MIKADLSGRRKVSILVCYETFGTSQCCQLVFESRGKETIRTMGPLQSEQEQQGGNLPYTATNEF